MFHLPTVIDVKRHLEKNGSTVRFTLGKDSGREVLPPTVTDPLELETPHIVQGDMGLNGRCIMLAVPEISHASAEHLSRLENAGEAGAEDSLFKLVQKTENIAARSKGSKRLSMLKIGFTDSSQHSHGQKFVHGFTLPGANDTSSLKLAHKCSSNHVPKCAGELSLAIAQGAHSLLKKQICKTDELLALCKTNRNEFNKWTTSQMELTKERPSMHKTGHSTGTTGSTGTKRKTTQVHLDDSNASAAFGGLPDHHVCLTHDPSIGFLVCLAMPDNKIQPVLAVQREFATTCFCGGSR